MTQEQPEKELPQLPNPSDPARTGCNDRGSECKVRVELLHRILDEVALLSHENYKESAIDLGLGYDPDWDQLLKYAVAEKCLTITARYNDVLIGYIIVLLGPFKHNKSIEYADIETMYVNPSFRDAPTIFKMLHMMEDNLVGKIEFIACSTPILSRIDTLFRYMKYKPVEIVLYKRLSGGSTETPSSTG